MSHWRSLLFVPGDQPERIAKAATRGADAIILDLEDAVAPLNKAAARAALPAAVASLAAGGGAVTVRINGAWLDAIADLEAAVLPGVTALIVPKAEGPRRLESLSEMITEHERARNIPNGSISLIALIESPAGLAELTAIAKVPRVIGLALGTEDFALSLGVEPLADMLELPCRQIALAAAPRKLMALAIPLSIAAFRDEAGCRSAAKRARGWGATGALCIHPAQVAIANDTFAATADEIAEAKAIMAAWDSDGGEQRGVVSFDGRMIDRPVVERARQRLSRRQI